MAIEAPHFYPGLQANGDMSSSQYYLVMHTATAGRVAVCTAATDKAIGSLYNLPSAAGDGADIADLSPGRPFKVVVGSAGVSAGNVGTTATGLLENKTTDKDYIIGQVDQAWDSGDFAIVMPNGGGYISSS